MIKKVIHNIKNYKKRYIFLFVVVLLVGFVVVRNSSKKQTAFETGNPVVSDLKKTLDVSGVIDAHNKASLRFLAGGKVTYVGAKEGDVVKKWQTIATVDTRSLQKSLEQGLNTFSSSLMDTEQTYDNSKDIHGNKATDRTIEKSNLALRNTALSVESYDIAIKNSSLASPISGILYDSPTNISGVILSPTDTFKIADPTSLFFVVDVDEADIGGVVVGQPVSISLDSYPDETIESKVESVSFQSVQGSNGTTYRVKIELPVDNTNLKYRMGMNGTARILLEEKSGVLSIPITALIQRGGKSYVQVINAGKPEEKEIVTGIETNEDIEVISGLSASDEVVIQ